MSQKWLRLISLLCLTAYLFANTNVSLALSAVKSRRPAAKSAEQKKPADEKSCTHICQHCAKKQAKPAESDNLSKPNLSQPGPSSPANSDCPCCPAGPSSPTCPCPGGCAWCSVAKVPCFTLLNLALLPALCVGESLVEEAPCYRPPIGNELMRPPRV